MVYSRAWMMASESTAYRITLRTAAWRDPGILRNSLLERHACRERETTRIAHLEARTAVAKLVWTRSCHHVCLSVGSRVGSPSLPHTHSSDTVPYTHFSAIVRRPREQPHTQRWCTTLISPDKLYLEGFGCGLRSANQLRFMHSS